MLEEMLTYLDLVEEERSLTTSMQELVGMLKADCVLGQVEYLDYTLSTYKASIATTQDEKDFADSVQSHLLEMYLLGKGKNYV